MNQSKAQISQDSQKSIKIRNMAFAKIRAKLEPIEIFEDRLKALQIDRDRLNKTQIS